MKILAIVIIYYPNVTELFKNINLYINDVDQLIIWDNTPLASRCDHNCFKSAFGDKVILMSTTKNEGIAYALNQGVKYGLANKYTHLLTMDQDSVWLDFAKFKNNIIVNVDDGHAVFAPSILDIVSGDLIRCNNYMQAITSGSIFPLSIFAKTGMFNENLFIDEVDNEYCYRCISFGYKIFISSNDFLKQEFGDINRKTFLHKYTQSYSAFRTYYQIRNRFWVWRKYSNILSLKYLLRIILIQIFRRSIIVVLAEDNKYDKLKAIINGIFDGLKKNEIKCTQIEK